MVRENAAWEGKGYAYFSNRACEYYPCHPVEDGAEFNCLFCYCPLYPLGHRCGGNFNYLENGIKDCSACLLPHQRESYGEITGRFDEICKLMQTFEKEP